MSDRIVQSRYFARFGELFVPMLTWLIITFPLWMSPFHPAIVAYFIIAFNLYFLYKAFTTAYYATKSYKLIMERSKISYQKKFRSMKGGGNLQHFIIIPNYKEPLYKIESTIDSFIANDYPYSNIFLVLAFEKRETEAVEKEVYLKNKYVGHFKDVLVAYHTLSSNEAPGKASNQTCAARMVDEYALKQGFLREECIITICDADSHLPTNYFSYLSFEFLNDKMRLYHFYCAPVLLYNNFWQLPFFVRMQATLSSILRLAFLSQEEKLIQISTYSASLSLLQKVDFWDVDIIPEDWHIYFQAFFAFGEKVRTLPLYTIINGDAVYSGSNMKTLFNRYEQEKRWAWGVSDIAYAWKKMFTTPHVPFRHKLKKIAYLTETHLFWPTSFFVLTISASIPPLINPIFKKTVLGFILPQLSGIILTAASLMLILYAYLDIQLRKKVNVKTSTINVPFLIIQWYLLPVVSFVLSSLPALEAHTRLLLGKKITYKVTEKV